MSTAPKLLAVDNVTKVFTIGGGFHRVRLRAVEEASFALPDGEPEIFTLAGESGCGKTTLARMILGLLEPTSGEVLFRETPVHELVKGGRRGKFNQAVQAVFQNPFETFNPLRPVETYLLETSRNYGAGGSSNGSAEAAAAEALKLVGIDYKDVEGKYPHEFSGGQLQRISIARALITGPKLILADEPVSMVDASLKMSVCNLFKVLKEERQVSVIYITHDLTTAYYVSDRIAVMFRGNIVEMGPVSSVLVDPKHPYTQILRDSVPEPDPAKKWRGRIKLSGFEERDFLKKGCKFSGRCPRVMPICDEEAPPIARLDGVLVKCHLYA
jgi:peptide/nickel transport system ATP-binding protein